MPGIHESFTENSPHLWLLIQQALEQKETRCLLRSWWFPSLCQHNLGTNQCDSPRNPQKQHCSMRQQLWAVPLLLWNLRCWWSSVQAEPNQGPIVLWPKCQYGLYVLKICRTFKLIHAVVLVVRYHLVW